MISWVLALCNTPEVYLSYSKQHESESLTLSPLRLGKAYHLWAKKYRACTQLHYFSLWTLVTLFRKHSLNEKLTWLVPEWLLCLHQRILSFGKRKIISPFDAYEATAERSRTIFQINANTYFWSRQTVCGKVLSTIPWPEDWKRQPNENAPKKILNHWNKLLKSYLNYYNYL